ncbi:MAG TPA: hypothetical protein VFB38_01505 [Chthonomonadaceae bacterium]|nr:hypothetical protein [Chthonomonadaceae bacterium]
MTDQEVQDSILGTLAQWAERADVSGEVPPMDAETLMYEAGIKPADFERNCAELLRSGLIQQTEDGGFEVTPMGLQENRRRSL